MTYQRIALIVLVAQAICLLTGCGKKEAAQTDAPEVVTVPVTHVVEKTLDRVDQLPGEIRAYQDVAVYPKVPGFIQWIGVDRGSDVKKGQLMVKLTAPELIAQKKESVSKSEATEGQLLEANSRMAAAKASLLEAKAQLAGDDDTYKRTKDASQVPGVVAPNDVIVLEQKVEADKQRVSAQEENLQAAQNQVKSVKDSLAAANRASEDTKDIADYLSVTAPFDGYVTERNMHVGSFVGPRGQGAYPPIVQVQQLDLLRIIVPVPEVDAGGVMPGAKVNFTVSTHPGEKFEGTVARIGNYLDRKTRTMPVELNYLNEKRRVLPGMFCEAYWPTRRHRPSMFVPTTAVESTSTLGMFVSRIDSNDEIEWVPVKRGELMGDMIEVFGNLKAGDTVALKADDALQPHTKIHPKEM